MKMHIDPSGLPKPLFHIVLVEPEIPNNTGNIGRLCVGLNSKLHIVGEPAFEISDSRVKRAGLDYWDELDLAQHDSIEAFRNEFSKAGGDVDRIFLLSTKAERTLYDVEIQPGDAFVFGKETKGLDEALLNQYSDAVIGLPMLGPIRSQNLANTVAVVMYEGIRQLL